MKYLSFLFVMLFFLPNEVLSNTDKKKDPYKQYKKHQGIYYQAVPASDGSTTFEQGKHLIIPITEGVRFYKLSWGVEV